MTTRSFLAGCALVVSAFGCGANSSSPATNATPSATAATATALSAEERAACGKREATELDSLVCLAAARRRSAAGDAANAKALLDLGCEQGDVDACTSGKQPEKAAAICAALGDLGKKLAACLRDHDDDVVTNADIPAKLPIRIALDVRAAYAPALLPILDDAKRACKEAETRGKVASLAGSALEKESGLLDAAIVCEGGKVGNPTRAGESMSTTFTARTLKDGLIASFDTLRVAAPGGGAEIGVFCPSRLVDDDNAADVWVKTKLDGGGTAMVMGAVHIATPCSNANVVASDAKERVVVAKAFAPAQAVVDGALAKLADRCDQDPEKLDIDKSPLAGDAIEKSAAVVGFEASCTFGYKGFGFATSRSLGHPGSMSISTERVRIDGRAVRVTGIKELPNRLDLTFRRRNAELTVAVKMTP